MRFEIDFWDEFTNAVKYDNIEVVKFLMEKGINLNIRDKYVKMFFIKEIKNNDLKKIKAFLLNVKERYLSQDIIDRTALMFAVIEDDLFTVKYLVKNMVDNDYINRQDEQGFTALMHAIWERSDSIAKYLIDNGAELDIKNHKGETALDLAIKYKNEDMVDYLKSKTNCDTNEEIVKETIKLLILPSYFIPSYFANLLDPDFITLEMSISLYKRIFLYNKLDEFRTNVSKEFNDEIDENVFRVIENCQCNRKTRCTIYEILHDIVTKKLLKEGELNGFLYKF